MKVQSTILSPNSCLDSYFTLNGVMKTLRWNCIDSIVNFFFLFSQALDDNRNEEICLVWKYRSLARYLNKHKF